MKRIVAASPMNGGLLHDPATGQAHRHATTRFGRLTFDDSRLLSAPLAEPGHQPAGTPRNLCWSPIVRCNLSCPHCLDDTAVSESGAAARFDIARILAESTVLGVDISGGEPLLLRELPDLARTITAAGHAVVSVTTNGWHLARRAAELVDAVDAVRVSFDGPDEASHDALRGAGSFHRAADGVRAAVAAGLPTQLQTVLMSDTAAQRVVDLAVGLGAGGVTFLQLLPIGAATTGHTDAMLSDEAAQQLIAGLQVPDGFRLRLRTRANAAGFTVIRADGRVWRNDDGALNIAPLRLLTTPSDLAAQEAR